MNKLRAALLASTVLTLASALPAAAQNATWELNPVSGDWHTSANWNPGVPTGTATFGVTNHANLTIAHDTYLDGWTFSAGASAYTVTNDILSTIKFTGAGIIIDGGSINLINNGITNFSIASNAGRATINNNLTLSFLDNATAGSATINNFNNFSVVSFGDYATAGDATINNSHHVFF